MSSGTAPRVTVILPVHDGGRYLREAVESILAQTLEDLELLVVDDGSTDGSAEALRSHPDTRLRLLVNPRNLGLTASLNRGLREARGALVARQDADDVSEARRLEEQASFLERHPDVALVGTQAIVIDGRGRAVGRLRRPVEHEAIRWHLLYENAFVHSSVMFRKSVVAGDLGGYDEGFRYCQDYDLWSRLTRKHRGANLDRFLVKCRVHPASLTETGGDANRLESSRALQENLRAVLGPDVDAVDVQAVLSLRSGLTDMTPGRFMDAFERLRRRYEARFPEARSRASYRRTVANQVGLVLRMGGFVDASVIRGMVALSVGGFPVLRGAVGEISGWVWGRVRRIG